MRAYHFTSDTLRDGRAIPPIGEWLEHEGEITPCESGLHASVNPFDALGFAPGGQLHLVEIEGEIAEHGDNKIVGRRRKILATVDAENMLWDFARWCALQMIDLWDAPDIVREYLETGDESKRAAARAAAMDAARAASRAASRDAAMDAARDAQREKFQQVVDAEFAKQKERH